VEEREGETEGTSFLPPKPAGPEPELGGRPPQVPPPPQAPAPQQAPAPPQAPAPLQAPAPPQAPATGAQPLGAPPPPGYGYPPPPGQPPPPGHAPPPGYGYPPTAPAQGYPPQWGYAQPAQPDNGPAVAGFVLALISGGLLVISLGMSSIISLVTAIFGVVYSRKGKKKIAAGETAKHGGLAQAGFIISCITLGLAILATLAYGLLVVLLIVSESFRDDFNDDFNNGQTITVTAAIALRAGARLIGG
jgi:hypothetical protein